MTITAEQVARAIERAQVADQYGVIASLGLERHMDAPADVRDAWSKREVASYAPLTAALARWRDELVEAERLDDTAPERLRERREALGLSHSVVANMMGMGAHAASVIVCVEPGGSLARDSSGYSKDVRTRYAAALSAEEERRGAQLLADEEARAAAFHAKPERPAPRFKVGEWVRDGSRGFRVAEMHWDDSDAVPMWYARAAVGVAEGIAESSLESYAGPASPPATEVVDVPQPIVKRCACSDIHDDVEATWQSGEPYLTVTHTTVPLALLRAMIEAIDAQQGGVR